MKHIVKICCLSLRDSYISMLMVTRNSKILFNAIFYKFMWTLNFFSFHTTDMNMSQKWCFRELAWGKADLGHTNGLKDADILQCP